MCVSAIAYSNFFKFSSKEWIEPDLYYECRYSEQSVCNMWVSIRSTSVWWSAVTFVIRILLTLSITGKIFPPITLKNCKYCKYEQRAILRNECLIAEKVNVFEVSYLCIRMHLCVLNSHLWFHGNTIAMAQIVLIVIANVIIFSITVIITEL